MTPTVRIAIGSRCTACGACIATCPERVLVPAPGRPAALGERCTACHACVEVCPVDAITLAEPGAARR